MSLTFPTDEIIPESVEMPEPEAGNDLACIVCGTALTYGGRGAKPKYCADHKPGRKTAGPSIPRANKTEKMRAELTASLGMIGIAVMAIDQYDGLVILDRSSATVDALLTVAEHNPKVRKVLEQMLEVSVWAALGTAIAGIAVPIAVHHNMLPLPAAAVEAQFLSEDTRNALEKIPAKAKRSKPEPQPEPNPFPNPFAD